jgi:malonate-semialdehyde dehydrogenase (acetylating)/methylmalonate-semialdehyde dehydrogenase
MLQSLQDAAKPALANKLLEEPMRTIGHFIGGREVKGTSGRTADVFEPMTGDVQAKVDLASKAEVRAAVENAKAAQLEWGATNPQRRARVMMKFLELAQRDYDKLADLLAREHGKTVPDAKGDIQRGLEVVEFACGIPHLMKGEYTEGAGPGIDIYSMRQPLGVVAGITPFNFPAMIPMWKFVPAIACGNAFILKPSERDPGVPMALAALMIEAGLPPGILNVVNGDKQAVDAILDDPDIRAVGFVGSSPIAGGARRQDHRRPADGETDSARREPEDRHLDRSVSGLRPTGHQGGAGARQELCRDRHPGRRHARGRWQKLQDAGLRERVLYGRLPVRQRHQGYAHLQGGNLRPRALGGARARL